MRCSRGNRARLCQRRTEVKQAEVEGELNKSRVHQRTMVIEMESQCSCRRRALVDGLERQMSRDGGSRVGFEAAQRLSRRGGHDDLPRSRQQRAVLCQSPLAPDSCQDWGHFTSNLPRPTLKMFKRGLTRREQVKSGNASPIRPCSESVDWRTRDAALLVPVSLR